MTKREKLRILKAVKKILEYEVANPYEVSWRGLCSMCRRVAENLFSVYDERYQNIRDLGLRCPRSRQSYADRYNFWYPIRDRGPRLRLVNNAIKRLQA